MVLLVRAERVPFLRPDLLERILWFLLRFSYRRTGESRIWGMPEVPGHIRTCLYVVGERARDLPLKFGFAI